MFPIKTPNKSRMARNLEVITPTGRVYHFPEVSLLHRLARLLGAHADIATVSATILVLIYVARLAGEELAAIDAWTQVARQAGLS